VAIVEESVSPGGGAWLGGQLFSAMIVPAISLTRQRSIYGVEYAFGAHDYPTSGVFEVEPKQCPGFKFRKSILIGITSLDHNQVREFMEHHAGSYNDLPPDRSVFNYVLPDALRVPAVEHIACSQSDESDKRTLRSTARTSLVITIGPSPRHRTETASTILFGQTMTTSSTNNSVFKGFFKKQKLTGPNFIDWYRQLRIVLSIEDKLHYLEQPITPVPEAPKGQQVAPEILKAHNAWIKGSKEIVGLMLMSMDLEIQRNLEPLRAHQMLKELKTLFAQQRDGTLEEELSSVFRRVNEEEEEHSFGSWWFSGLEIVLNNCHYAPSITRGVIFVSHLFEDGFVNRFVDNTIQVSRNNVVYFSAVPRDGIFEIDLSNSFTNESSIYVVSNKRAKLDLDSALLWHCRLGHISKKHTEKLQHDGLLNSSDLKAFEKCVSCMFGKMARKPYTHQVERAKDLLGLIHTDVISVKTYLGKCFAMKDLGEAAYILRIKINQERSKQLIGLCQSAYIEKILKRYCIKNSKRGSIPMQEKLKLSKSQGASTPAELKRMQNVPYVSVVGSIMYVVRCTHPDVAFAQNITSRFQQNPGDIQWTTVKNILKYLKNTKDMFLVYRGDQKRELRVSFYTDAGYLTDADDLKSQTGYVFVFNGGAVDWKSAKQNIFATSSAEAEYITAFNASKEAVWVRKFISGLTNESGITKGARHFRAKVHYLREVIEFGDIKLEKFHTDDNLADPFTKALAFPKHSEHIKNIGMLPASSLM
nr:hypothetical protein [Tanacetum cinerariifolium]